MQKQGIGMPKKGGERERERKRDAPNHFQLYIPSSAPRYKKYDCAICL